jgi:hypothetical protein
LFVVFVKVRALEYAPGLRPFAFPLTVKEMLAPPVPTEPDVEDGVSQVGKFEIE